MYINKAIIYGNLVRDPEMRALPSGVQVVNFSVATNRVYKDKNGAKQESTEYHNVVAFARIAELIKQYVHKGDGIYIEGRMQTRSWEGPDKVKKYRSEIIAETMQFGNKRGPGSPGGDYGGGDSASKSPAPKDDSQEIAYPDEQINPEDIPF